MHYIVYAIVTLYIIDKYIVGDFVLLITSINLFLTKVLAATFVYIEIKSIGENVEIITGKNFWKIFKELLSKTKELKQEVENVGLSVKKKNLKLINQITVISIKHNYHYKTRFFTINS